jgi:hypothetical protein
VPGLREHRIHAQRKPCTSRLTASARSDSWGFPRFWRNRIGSEKIAQVGTFSNGVRFFQMFCEKTTANRQLVNERKECHACSGLTNPEACGNSSFDSDHVGPMSLWQGNLDADLMIVGQDWGHRPGQGERHRSRHGAAGGESEGFRTSHRHPCKSLSTEKHESSVRALESALCV